MPSSLTVWDIRPLSPYPSTVKVATLEYHTLVSSLALTSACSNSEIGIETTRGTVKGGIYIEDPEVQPRADFLLTSNSVPSLYDHVHSVLGHPGYAGMAWHQKNTVNAAYTFRDASASCPVCASCVYGSMRQTNTDHRRQYHEQPTVAGQQFSLDAYTHLIVDLSIVIY